MASIDTLYSKITLQCDNIGKLIATGQCERVSVHVPSTINSDMDTVTDWYSFRVHNVSFSERMIAELNKANSLDTLVIGLIVFAGNISASSLSINGERFIFWYDDRVYDRNGRIIEG